MYSTVRVGSYIKWKQERISKQLQIVNVITQLCMGVDIIS
jgi:hypothetical protein